MTSYCRTTAATRCHHAAQRGVHELRRAMRNASPYDADTRAALEAATATAAHALASIRAKARGLAIAEGNRTRAEKRRDIAEKRAVVRDAVRRMERAVNAALPRRLA